MKELKKDKELKRMYEVVDASFDYIIYKYSPNKDKDPEIIEYYKKKKEEAKVMYENGKVKKLAKWYRDMTEGAVHNEAEVLYIKEKTGCDIVALDELNKRVNKIIRRKKINTEDEYYDVMEMLSQLNVKSEPEKMDILQKLIDEFDHTP